MRRAWSCGTGNPGAADFYIPFLSALHTLTRGQIEIVAVEHAGHSVLEASEMEPPGPMHVVEQIHHKVAFLTKLHAEDRRRRFILAGHSVGAYICTQARAVRADGAAAATANEVGSSGGVPDDHAHRARPQLLQEDAPWTIKHVYCLLPTLHDIGATPNGRRLTVSVQAARACCSAGRLRTQARADLTADRSRLGERPLPPHHPQPPPHPTLFQPVFGAWPRFLVSSLAGGLRWLPLSVRQAMVTNLTTQAPDAAAITAHRLLEYGEPYPGVFRSRHGLITARCCVDGRVGVSQWTRMQQLLVHGWHRDGAHPST